MKIAKKLAALTLAAAAIFAPQAAMATPRIPVVHERRSSDGTWVWDQAEIDRLAAATPGANLYIIDIPEDPNAPQTVTVFATGCDSSAPRWQQTECTNDFIDQNDKAQAFKRGDYL